MTCYASGLNTISIGATVYVGIIGNVILKKKDNLLVCNFIDIFLKTCKYILSIIILKC